MEQVPVFAEIAGKNEKFVDLVGEALHRREYQSGEAVLRTGEHGAEMFFITEGECEVVVDGVQVAIIGHGEFFGETGVLALVFVVAQRNCLWVLL